MKIEIERDTSSATSAGSYTVRCGEVWDDKLTAGEALEVVAVFLFRGRDALPYLINAATHEARDKRWKEKPEDLTDAVESQ